MRWCSVQAPEKELRLALGVDEGETLTFAPHCSRVADACACPATHFDAPLLRYEACRSVQEMHE